MKHLQGQNLYMRLMGHEGINITFNYAHLYPSKQKALADKLNEDRGDVDATEKKEA